MHSVFVGPEAPFFLVTNSNTFQFEKLKTELNNSSDWGYLDGQNLTKDSAPICCFFMITKIFLEIELINKKLIKNSIYYHKFTCKVTHVIFVVILTLNSVKNQKLFCWQIIRGATNRGLAVIDYFLILYLNKVFPVLKWFACFQAHFRGGKKPIFESQQELKFGSVEFPTKGCSDLSFLKKGNVSWILVISLFTHPKGCGLKW